eukprot:4212322-Prymnesium_polylepis.1
MFGSFSADGALLACGGGNIFGGDAKVTVYETSGWAVVKELEHSATVSDGARARRGGTHGWALRGA